MSCKGSPTLRFGFAVRRSQALRVPRFPASSFDFALVYFPRRSPFSVRHPVRHVLMVWLLVGRVSALFSAPFKSRAIGYGATVSIRPRRSVGSALMCTEFGSHFLQPENDWKRRQRHLRTERSLPCIFKNSNESPVYPNSAAHHLTPLITSPPPPTPPPVICPDLQNKPPTSPEPQSLAVVCILPPAPNHNLSLKATFNA